MRQMATPLPNASCEKGHFAHAAAFEAIAAIAMIGKEFQGQAGAGKPRIA